MSTDKHVLAAGAALVFAAGVSTLATAQEVSNFKRDRNVSVRQRPHEGFEPLGLSMGAFRAWPRLTVTAEHNDNIYATSTNEVDDMIWRIQPELSVTSNWSRHAVNAFARGTFERYQDFSDENFEDYAIGLGGRIDVSRGGEVTFAVDTSELTEPRTSPGSPTDAVAPTEYYLSTAQVGFANEFNRARISGSLRRQSYDYDDGRRGNGTNIDQDYRDRKVTELTGRFDYAVSPDTALFVEVVGNTREYDTTAGLNRDSDGVTVLAGANFELSALTRGEIAVGYLNQDYDAAALEELDGFAARAQVEWFVTPLTTVTLNATRNVQDSPVNGAAGFISTGFGGQVDHEVMPNLILTAQAGFTNDDYQNIAREDDRVNWSVSGTYLLNRNVGVTVGYSALDLDTKNDPGNTGHTVNKFGASLTLQF